MRTAMVTGGSRRARVDVAESRAERMRGLIGRPASRGLLLPRTRSVHTFGMGRAIDVLLLDARLRVLGIVRLPEGRVLLPRRGVRHVLELDRSPFAVGDALVLTEDGADPDGPLGELAQRQPDRSEQEDRGPYEDGHRGRYSPPGPRGERHRLAPPDGRGDEAKELQQLQQAPHGDPSASHASG